MVTWNRTTNKKISPQRESLLQDTPRPISKYRCFRVLANATRTLLYHLNNTKITSYMCTSDKYVFMLMQNEEQNQFLLLPCSRQLHTNVSVLLLSISSTNSSLALPLCMPCVMYVLGPEICS